MLLYGILNQRLSVYSVVFDGYGDSTKTIKYLNLPCRFIQKQEKVLDKTGDEVICSAQAWLPPQDENGTRFELAVTDIILYNDLEYKIVSIYQGVNFSGTTEYLKVYLR